MSALQCQLAHRGQRSRTAKRALGAQVVVDVLVDVTLLALGDLDASESRRAVAFLCSDDLVVDLRTQEDHHRANVECVPVAEVQVDRQLVGRVLNVILDDDLLEEAVLAHAVTAVSTLAGRNQRGEFELGVGDRHDNEGWPDRLAIVEFECDHGCFLLTTEVFSRAVKRHISSCCVTEPTLGQITGANSEQLL